MPSSNKHNDSLKHLLPTPQLGEKWSGLVAEKRAIKDKENRERQFQFAHGWLAGLIDAGLLSSANRDDLRELLVKA